MLQKQLKAIQEFDRDDFKELEKLAVLLKTIPEKDAEALIPNVLKKDTSISQASLQSEESEKSQVEDTPDDDRAIRSE